MGRYEREILDKTLETLKNKYDVSEEECKIAEDQITSNWQDFVEFNRAIDLLIDLGDLSEEEALKIVLNSNWKVNAGIDNFINLGLEEYYNG